MSIASHHRSDASIDPAFVALIVRKVMEQLRCKQVLQQSGATGTNRVAVSISEHVITTEVIDQTTGSANQIFIASKSIVTPAAVDLAKERGIEITRSIELPPAMLPKLAPENQKTERQKREITDASRPERATAVMEQLRRRGITHIGSLIVLSDTPALDLHRLISQHSRRAAMVNLLADVDRYAAEMKPDSWVIDMGRMNLIAAVNAAARIAQHVS